MDDAQRQNGPNQDLFLCACFWLFLQKRHNSTAMCSNSVIPFFHTHAQDYCKMEQQHTMSLDVHVIPSNGGRSPFPLIYKMIQGSLLPRVPSRLSLRIPTRIDGSLKQVCVYIMTGLQDYHKINMQGQPPIAGYGSNFLHAGFPLKTTFITMWLSVIQSQCKMTIE